ncbi:DUF2889 domain-containing protein [Pseudomonas sp. JQ170]|uniref:DUF2889 domain-containing protein n=1 Tax=unclassified Pseudomonas TaxID=196821 RepID=UPI0026524617|nr:MULTISPECIES: DUF2889 domain-containing protein [unclassified Pseudomonas]MDN7139807.1 DUF2889 domain-containing protein [Pseudomonas sp. JQ170]WRO73739.1 DUF2889 domain-containing protein [Pseudomonas sp. 170C]
MAVPISGHPKRRLLHTRKVVCSGYEREDGLFDIEGCLLDTKGIATQFVYNTVPADGVLHYMRITMTLDLNMEIRQLTAVTEKAPTPVCGQVNRAYAALVGLRIGPGFKQRVAERVGGLKGCTHLTEMLGPMATTAIQTLAPVMQKRLRERAATDPDFKMPDHWVIGTCHAYHPDGDAARRVNEWRPGNDAGAHNPHEAPDEDELRTHLRPARPSLRRS